MFAADGGDFDKLLAFLKNNTRNTTKSIGCDFNGQTYFFGAQQ